MTNVITRGFKTEQEAIDFRNTIKGQWDIVEIRDQSITGEVIGYYLSNIEPFAFAVVSNQCPDDMENMSLQFNHPEMSGQEYKKAIPLFAK